MRVTTKPVNYLAKSIPRGNVGIGTSLARLTAVPGLSCMLMILHESP